MSVLFNNFLSSINFKNYICNVNERKIIIYGPKLRNEKLKKYIEDAGYKIYLSIDNEQENFQNKNILKGKNSDFYLFITEDYKEELENFLINNGYSEIKDYLYIIHKPVIVYNDNMYVDMYGNTIKAPKGTRFTALGYNSSVNIETEINDKINITCTNSSLIIGKDCDIKNNILIECNSNSYIKIDDKCRIGSNVKILCGDNSKVQLDTASRMLDDSLIGSFNKSSIHIGKKAIFHIRTTFFSEKQSEINVGEETIAGVHFICVTKFGGKIDIGRDCLFSEDVVFMNNDGHPIFNVESGERINGGKSIIIDEHVWIGIKCTILSKARIREGSIIGANSLINKEFPNNCIIAGNPAKIIKKDIAWDRDEMNSELINKDKYWNLTSSI